MAISLNGRLKKRVSSRGDPFFVVVGFAERR